MMQPGRRPHWHLGILLFHNVFMLHAESLIAGVVLAWGWSLDGAPVKMLIYLFTRYRVEDRVMLLEAC